MSRETASSRSAGAGSIRSPTGYICSKVRRLPEHVHGPRRVRYPGIREGRKGEGRFRRATWDEALSLVAERMSALSRSGRGERILPFYYGGSNGYISHDSADARLFTRLKASRLARTVCAAPSTAAAAGLYGKMPGIALQDYRLAKMILLWGVNPSVSGIHIVPYILEARKRGAKLAVVDPRRTRLAEHADLHLAPRPGGDLPIALAVIRWLFESGHADEKFLAEHATGAGELRRRADGWTLEKAAEASGVPAGQIESLARMYAEASPAAVRCGWGLERNRNGGSAVAAVLALPAVAGKFGVRGGGYTMSNGKAFDLEARSASGELPADGLSTREINMNHLGRTLLGGAGEPVELLFVYNCNPLATMPNQRKVREGLSREDLFTVVFDPVMTDTAMYADVVLPATTFLERGAVARVRRDGSPGRKAGHPPGWGIAAQPRGFCRAHDADGARAPRGPADRVRDDRGDSRQERLRGAPCPGDGHRGDRQRLRGRLHAHPVRRCLSR